MVLDAKGLRTQSSGDSEVKASAEAKKPVPYSKGKKVELQFCDSPSMPVFAQGEADNNTFSRTNPLSD